MSVFFFHTRLNWLVSGSAIDNAPFIMLGIDVNRSLISRITCDIALFKVVLYDIHGHNIPKLFNKIHAVNVLYQEQKLFTK